METRANHILIGLFALIGILGGMLLFLFLAKAEADRDYAYYDVRFDSVSGLREAGAVRYNGLPVGQVTGMFLDPGRPDSVRVRIEVDATTPVVQGTVATLEAQGVTGVSYVALSGGEQGAAPLRPAPGETVAEIPSEKSAIASIFEGAPKVMDEALRLLTELRAIVSPQNQQAMTGILTNLESASGGISTVVADFGALSTDIGAAARKLSDFTERLDSVAVVTEEAMQAATSTLGAAEDALHRAGPAIDSAGRALTSADTLMTDTLPALAARVGDAAGTVDRVTGELGATTKSAVETLAARADSIGAAAEARLGQAEGTLVALNQALAQAGETLRAVEQASDGVTVVGGLAAERLREAEGAVAELQAAMEAATATLASLEAAGNSARRVMDEDVPTLVKRTEGVPALIADAQTAAGAVGEAARAATRLADQTTARMTEAQATLASADAALVSVREAADGVNTLARGDGAALIADARAAVASANGAIASIDRAARIDLPSIVTDVRAAARAAATGIEQVTLDLKDTTGKLPALADQGLKTLQDASDIFARANVTLGQIDGAMQSARTTLGTANSAFAAADGLMREDASEILGDLSAMADTLRATADQVAADLPQASAELQRTMTAARELAATLNGVVGENQDQIRAFMHAGLPQFVRFMQEGRGLVENMQRLVDKIERDPARFLLGTQRPDFKR